MLNLFSLFIQRKKEGGREREERGDGGVCQSCCSSPGGIMFAEVCLYSLNLILGVCNNPEYSSNNNNNNTYMFGIL